MEIAGIIIAVFFGWVLIGSWNERRRIMREWDNYYRVDMAKTLYGNDWYRKLKECDESHIANECELCINISDE